MSVALRGGAVRPYGAPAGAEKDGPYQKQRCFVSEAAGAPLDQGETIDTMRISSPRTERDHSGNDTGNVEPGPGSVVFFDIDVLLSFPASRR